MKSVVCYEPGRLGIEDRAEPQLSEGLVKLRIRRIGVCGTDYHIFKGLHPFLEYPRVMGHELSGEIVGINDGSELTVGTTVIVNPYLPCGQCVACRKGKPNCCTNISVLGVHTDGGMCEFVTVPEKQVYVADGLSIDQAAMVEFLAIGAHGVRRGRIASGDKVLVVGAGPIGLGAAMFAAIAGANVAVLDMSEARVLRAEQLIKNAKGFAASDNLRETFSNHTDGDMFDVVIDATGNKKAMETSLTYVAHGGSCVFLSVVKDEIVFDDPFFHSREMSLIGSRNANGEDFEHVVSCIKKGLIPTEELNTHTASLEQLPSKLPQWMTEQDTLIKAIVSV